MESFYEQIAQVTYRHDDSKNNILAQIYKIEKLPLNFPLNINIDFLNINPNKNYILKLIILKNTEPLQTAHEDIQTFNVSYENMIFVKNGFG